MKRVYFALCMGLFAASGGACSSTNGGAKGTGGKATSGSSGGTGAHGGAGSSGSAGGHGGGCSGIDAGMPVCTPSGSLDSSSAPRTPATSVPAATLQAAVDANNAFTVDLYQRLLSGAGTASANVVSSPLSAWIALTMTSAGAAGNTATQMQKALHLPSAPSIFDGQNALLQALGTRAASAYAGDQSTDTCASDYQLQIVNAVWGQETLTWQPTFLGVLAQSYGIGVRDVDFAKDFSTAEQDINGWVSCETAGKIPSVLPKGTLNTCTAMVLVDALHLKLPWQTPFSKTATAPGPFTNGSGSTVTPSFMEQTSGYAYVDDGNAQIVALPLGDGEISVVIALPHGSLESYEASLQVGVAPLAVPNAWVSVDLSLPKFDFTSPIFSLVSELQAMGMTDAFGPAADLSGLVSSEPTFPPCCPQVLQIGPVLQKASMGIQESGIDATAATAVVVSAEGVGGSSAGPPGVPAVMHVDRPFLFSVVDATGAVLLIGHVQDPTVTTNGADWAPTPGGC